MAASTMFRSDRCAGGSSAIEKSLLLKQAGTKSDWRAKVPSPV
eukprot:CAMPEP_0178448306 /NCGR_PEP_ID=MMETSP0689_2-20121128/41911_1 /TAXON_ID=160604 /ORGANISM="Amphidinium massartii, Strain CS-259" /LENGTH=42 /DNA_ID= /DNA_START= /DNA_END= /DNA_ORIENTATION=